DVVVDCVQINSSFIRHVMEHIHSSDRIRPLLLISKDQINPLVQMCRDIITLECLTMLLDKDLRVIFGPWWQSNMINLFSCRLQGAEVECVGIHQELRQVKELRDKFSNI